MPKVKPNKDAQRVTCAVCGNSFSCGQTRDARVVRPDLAKLILSIRA